MSSRPNILLVMTDEERERCWFPDDVRFPNRERLAESGLSFRAHHASTTPCTPSRAVMFTGHHAPDVGVVDNVNFAWQGPLDKAVPTLGARLRDAGYRCAYKGKWHLGGEELRHGLSAYGFDDWDPPDAHGTPYMGRFLDGRTASRAARWIEDRAGDSTPWFLTVSFVNPHDIMFYPRFRKPWVTERDIDMPANFGDDLASKPVVQRLWRRTFDITAGRVRDADVWHMMVNAYIDLALEVDRHIGTVVDALVHAGVRDETLVAFTSDHGEMAGAHGLRQKGAFVYRENLQVPLAMAWPGHIPEGAETQSLTSALDVVPTLCAVAGLDAPGLAGADLTPLFDDPAHSVRDAMLVTSDSYSSAAGRTDIPGFMRGIITDRWKFARYFRPGDQHADLDTCDLELYDTHEDPLELDNRAGDPLAKATLVDLDAELRTLVAAEIGPDDRVPVRTRSRLDLLRPVLGRMAAGDTSALDVPR